MSGPEVKQAALPWTGERYIPELRGQIALEHLHRYALACELADGKAVLDVACGEGYGSAMLAERARSVVGIDLSVDVAVHAARRYSRPHLSFAAGRCDDLPLAAASHDLITCFETIEHVDAHERVLAEFKRVLRPGGVLIISSPEKAEYSDGPKHENPFHVKELYAHEFRALLQDHFRNVTLGGQRVVFGSAILMEGSGGPLRTYERDGTRCIGASAMNRPQYLIAIASDLPFPALGGGVFEQPINDTDIVQGWATAVTELNVKLADRESAAAADAQAREALTRRVDVQKSEITAAYTALQHQLDQVSRLEKEVATREAALDRIRASLAWRLSAPIRALARLFK